MTVQSATPIAKEISFNTGCELENLYLYSPQNEQFVNTIIAFMNPDKTAYEMLDIDLKIKRLATKAALHLENIVFALASKISDDYNGGMWAFNDSQIYILDSDDQFTVSNPNKYRNESLNNIEFSLFVQISALHYVAATSDCEITNEALSYWWDKTRLIAFNPDNGFDSSTLYSIE